MAKAAVHAPDDSRIERDPEVLRIARMLKTSIGLALVMIENVGHDDEALLAEYRRYLEAGNWERYERHRRDEAYRGAALAAQAQRSASNGSGR